jgi:metal-responsive CopG/Arc/MetJ family transcriptional regulator
MKTKRAHVLLPMDLVQEIDTIVGPRGRSAFLVETAREAIRRKRVLKQGSAAWVRKLRRENESRLRKKPKPESK